MNKNVDYIALHNVKIYNGKKVSSIPPPVVNKNLELDFSKTDKSLQ